MVDDVNELSGWLGMNSRPHITRDINNCHEGQISCTRGRWEQSTTQGGDDMSGAWGTVLGPHTNLFKLFWFQEREQKEKKENGAKSGVLISCPKLVAR